MTNRSFFIITFIYSIFLCNLHAQTNLSPRSAATAQTFGTFFSGLDAVNWNPALLAYQIRDTIYHIHVVSTPSRKTSDSLITRMENIFYIVEK